MTINAKRLKDLIWLIGVPKAYIMVRTKTKRIRLSDGRYAYQYGDVWAALICPLDKLEGYASKLEEWDEEVEVKRFTNLDGQLIAVHVYERIN